MRAVLLVFVAMQSVALSLNYNGSTPGLKEIVIGRCLSYIASKPQGENVSCTILWEAFRDSFAFKDPCRLELQDYESFLVLIPKKEITDKGLLWSGTKKAVHVYADFDLRYTTMEDTMEGSMLDGLSWCGNPSLPPSSDGIDYVSCPKCERKHQNVFWKLASKAFAQRLRGIVRVMVNGSRGSAYRRDSIFASYELPSLNLNLVKKLVVLVAHTIVEEKTYSEEYCGTGSIKMLQDDAEALGISNVHCTNDPDGVKHILCADHPKAYECKFYYERQKSKEWGFVIISSAVISVVFLTTTTFLIIYIMMNHQRFKKQSFIRKKDTNRQICE